MAILVQPQNREKELKTILDNYKKFINHTYWLSDILQKDGIQNSWGARVGKGKNWTCKIFYSKKNDYDIAGIIDHGTTGLTGIIPNNESDIRRALDENNPYIEKERLSAFLSQDWSSKSWADLGSRGRGKAIFIASSKEKRIYFDSLRVTDNRYVFGSIYLDKNTKEIKEEILSDEQAYNKIKQTFGNNIKSLKDYGTRIFIIKPDEKLIEAITQGYIDDFIKSTWWEILEKYKASIEIVLNGKSRIIENSQILPVNKMQIKESYHSGLIRLPKNNELKIKNIALCYLGDKDIPEFYKGISIQRGGMAIERYQTEKLLDEEFSNKIFGSIEMESELESEMHKHEGPEHCDFRWVENPPAIILKLIKQEIKKFAQKFKLIEYEDIHVDKKQRETELNTLKELNDFANKIGLKGLGWKNKKRNVENRDDNKLIRLSFSDFELPGTTPRVEIGNLIKGAYVKPINQTDKSIQVLVRIFILNESKKELSLQEKVIPLSKTTVEKIGWDEIKINEIYTPGKYTIKAKLISLENININEEINYEKGDEIYITSRSFYVGVDPKSKGLFEDIKAQKDLSKDKFIWVEESNSGEGFVLFYNLLHPIIKKLIDKDQDTLKEQWIREGLIYLLQIRFSEDQNLLKENLKPVYFNEKSLKENGISEIIKILLKHRSIFLWDREK